MLLCCLTVEHCAGVDRIQSLRSIVQIWDESPFYFVTCDDEVGVVWWVKYNTQVDNKMLASDWLL